MYTVCLRSHGGTVSRAVVHRDGQFWAAPGGHAEATRLSLAEAFLVSAWIRQHHHAGSAEFLLA